MQLQPWRGVRLAQLKSGCLSGRVKEMARCNTDSDGPTTARWFRGSFGGVRLRRDRATAPLQHICVFRFLCFVCPIRFSIGNANARIDLVAATMQSLSRLDPAQRDQFFEAFVSAALRLDQVAMRDWLRKRLRNRPFAAPVDLAAFAISDRDIALLLRGS
jgi:hypothetical protein